MTNVKNKHYQEVFARRYCPFVEIFLGLLVHTLWKHNGADPVIGISISAFMKKIHNVEGDCLKYT